MPSLRATRKSSRTSSPFVRTANESPAPAPAPAPANEQKKERVQMLLDGWIEPPIRNPAPSFEDHGFARGGVLEHMAPLGTLPSTKLKLKLRAESSRRPNVNRNGVPYAVEEAQETPDSTPSAEPGRSESQKPEEEQLPPPLAVTKEEEDDSDYVPNGAKPASSKHVKGVKNNQGSDSQTGRVSASRNTPVSAAATAASEARRQKLEPVINVAVAKAISAGNRKLGRTLRRVFEESLHDPAVARLLEAVSDTQQTKEEYDEFQALMEKARKQIKAEKAIAQKTQKSGTPSANRAAVTIDLPSDSNFAPPTPATQINSTNLHHTPSLQSPLTHRQKSPLKQSTTNGQMPQSNGMDSSRPPPRSRSGSVTSTSSLSSVDENIVEEGPPISMGMNGTSSAGADGPSTNASSSRSSLNAKSQRALNFKPGVNALKRSSAAAGFSEDEIDSAALEAKRQKLLRSFPDVKVEESNIRQIPVVERSELSTGHPASTAGAAQPPRLQNGFTRFNPRSDRSNLASPLSDGFASGSRVPSRPDTPSGLGRPAKRQKTAARTKMSPVKSRSGVVAGIARAGGGRDSPIGYDDNNEVQSDNNDYCSTCGGTGFLLCCDGCDRSFHFTCCDPPLNQNAAELDEPWYCYNCQASKTASDKYPNGLFSGLFRALERRNPSAFEVPKEIREFFEGVRTGPEGEYEDGLTVDMGKNRAGWVDPPDYTKLKDSKGAAILCVQCGGSSLSQRKIIQCDICADNWHLDCLDPPLANPPPLPQNGKPRPAWCCPRHTEHDLRSLGNPAMHADGTAGRVHRLRKPKNPRIVDASLSRGFKNNGIIEIANESDDDDFVEEEEEGVVFRLPERGIKLDFIDKIKQSVLAVQQRQQAISTAHSHAQANFNKRKFITQKTAINLVQLAEKTDDLPIAPDGLQTLIMGLTAESPESVVRAMSDAETVATSRSMPSPPSPPSSDKLELSVDEERAQLFYLQKLIERRLQATQNGS